MALRVVTPTSNSLGTTAGQTSMQAWQAERGIDPPGLLADPDRKAPGDPVTSYLRIGPERSIISCWPTATILGVQNAGRAVQGGKGLIEHGHVATDRAALFHQIDLLARSGDLQGRLNSGDTTAITRVSGCTGVVGSGWTARPKGTPEPRTPPSPWPYP